MNRLCIILAIGLAVLFSAVNLFLPYALIVLGLFWLLAYSCAGSRKSKAGTCRLGFC